MARGNVNDEEGAIPLLPTPTSFSYEPAKLVSKLDAIPWKHLFPILALRLSDGMAYGVIFPFITAYLVSIHAPADKIGLYAGMAEGTLMLVEAALATTWARLADKYGRRHCMIWGFAATTVACGSMGLCTKAWQIIFWRAACGVNPGGVLQKTMAGELSNASNRDRVFAIYSPIWIGGFMLGTLIGGELAAPYGRLPEVLSGRWEIWKTHPYALPCLVAAFVDVVVLIICALYLVETRPPGCEKGEGQGASLPSHGATLMATLRIRRFAVSLCIFLFFQITYSSYDALFAVYTYTQVEAGGLGLPVAVTGRFYAVFSALQLIATPFFLPFLRRKLGTRYTMTIIALAWIGTALLVPVSQRLAVSNRTVLWPVLGGQQTLKSLATLAWPMCDIVLMTLLEPHPDLLATASAMTLMAGAGGRAVGPPLAGWSFSLSGQYAEGTPGRQIPWLLLLAVALPPLFMVPLLGDTPKTPSDRGYEQLSSLATTDSPVEDD